MPKIIFTDQTGFFCATIVRKENKQTDKQTATNKEREKETNKERERERERENEINENVLMPEFIPD